MKIKFSLNEKMLCTGLGCIVGLMLLIIVVIALMSQFKVHESFHNPDDPDTIVQKGKFIENIGKLIEKELGDISLNENEAVNIEECKNKFLEKLEKNAAVDDLFNLGITYRNMRNSLVSGTIKRIRNCASTSNATSDTQDSSDSNA